MITGCDVMVTIRRVDSSPSVVFLMTATAAHDGTIDRKNPVAWLDRSIRREVMTKLRAAYLAFDAG